MRDNFALLFISISLSHSARVPLIWINYILLHVICISRSDKAHLNEQITKSVVNFAKFAEVTSLITNVLEFPIIVCHEKQTLGCLNKTKCQLT